MKGLAKVRQKSGRNVVPPGFCVVQQGYPKLYILASLKKELLKNKSNLI
jgi:hypothetical protein